MEILKVLFRCQFCIWPVQEELLELQLLLLFAFWHLASASLHHYSFFSFRNMLHPIIFWRLRINLKNGRFIKVEVRFIKANLDSIYYWLTGKKTMNTEWMNRIWQAWKLCDYDWWTVGLFGFITISLLLC